MPTAAKAVSAFYFAALAWYVSTYIPPLFEESGQRFTWFFQINAALGALIGWRVVGRRAGAGISQAVGVGVTGGAALGIVALFAHSSAHMLKQSLRKAYDGPAEAVVAVFEIGLDFGRQAFTVEVIIALLVGGIIGGLIAEYMTKVAN